MSVQGRGPRADRNTMLPLRPCLENTIELVPNIMFVAGFQLFAAVNPGHQVIYVGTLFVQLCQCETQGSSHQLASTVTLVNTFYSDVKSDYNIIVLGIPMSKEAGRRQQPLFTVFLQ
jgi:hypothetical protein